MGLRLPMHLRRICPTLLFTLGPVALPSLWAQTTVTLTGDSVTPYTTTSANPRTLSVSSGAFTHNAAIDGDGSLTKSGAGKLTLSGNNTHTGGTRLTADVLELGSAGALGGSGTISFAGGTLRFSAANTTDYSSRFATSSQTYRLDTTGQDVTFASQFSGSDSNALFKSRSGKLTLNSNNSLGNATISGGTVKEPLINPTSRRCLVCEFLPSWPCVTRRGPGRRRGPARQARVYHQLRPGRPGQHRRRRDAAVQKMAAEGTHTWEAYTIVPSITLPSHVSMLTGVGIQILWNEWDPTKPRLAVPTIFQLAKARGLSTAMIASKSKFKTLEAVGGLDAFVIPEDYLCKGIAAATAELLRKQRPNLAFIHFGAPDFAGHKYGAHSPEKMQALVDCDVALKVIRDAVEAAGIGASSAFILTADHGGHDRPPAEIADRIRRNLPPPPAPTAQPTPPTWSSRGSPSARA